MQRLPDFELLTIAHRLLKSGIRPNLVAHSTGLALSVVAQIRKGMQGAQPKKGLLRVSAKAYIRTPQDAQRLATFCSLYLAEDEAGQENVAGSAARRLADTLDRYNSLSDEPLEGTLAWMAARDLAGNGLLETRLCQVCRVRYIYDIQVPALRGCPFCCAVQPPPASEKGKAPRRSQSVAPLARKKESDCSTVKPLCERRITRQNAVIRTLF